MSSPPNGNPILNDSEQSESETEQFVAPDETVQMRRTQNMQFQDLLTRRVREDVTSHTQRAKAVADAPDEQLSLASLVAKKDLGLENLDPRAYQIELFERAKNRNIIAVLDTGSGKTLIAVLLLRNILKQELEDRANGKRHRVSVFLVDSVTLVFQQAAVLRNNLDQNVGQIYGAIGSDLWDEEIWQAQLTKNMAIVCTADIIQQALLNAFIKMSGINLLIFDEAHHTKKEHPYARIIRDSYLKEDISTRPKVFGMTASPIDAKVNISEAARELELLLDSQIATTSNLSALRQIVRKPTEEIRSFKKLVEPYETELFRRMKEKFGDIKALAPIFEFSRAASSELGSWCADRVWAKTLVEDVIPKLDACLAKEGLEGSADTYQVERDIDKAKEACEIVKAHPFKSPLEPGQLSSKVELLLAILSRHFGHEKEKKCIVFTKKRNTARVLLEFCEQLNIPNFRPGVLVGIRKSDLTGATTFRKQFLVLLRFRRGEINCLFATSVAEEGLDVPDCNLVIRFDLYDTMIQYIQSRGRARHVHSMYIHMVEMDNDEHHKRIQEGQQAENAMNSFCRALPQDRLLYGDEINVDKLFENKGEKRTYTIQSTGARLTYRHAMYVLSRYAESLQYEKDISTQVTYFVTSAGSSFFCEVILPEKSPIRGLTGGTVSTKVLAKQSAAFDMCLLLRKKHLLDDNFRSIYHKRLPAMRNAKLAIVSKKTNKYDMLWKPSIWRENQGYTPDKLYIMVFSFLPLQPLSREHRNIALLTRVRLPVIPNFPIFLEYDKETTIQTTVVNSTISVLDHDLTCLSQFTLAVFRDAFHKTFEPITETFPYWLAPVNTEISIDSPNILPKDVIDWKLLNFVNERPEIKWSKEMDPAALLSCFIYDCWDGRRRFFPLSIDPSLRASDTPPSYVPPRKWMTDIFNYSLSLSKNSRQKVVDKADWEQPVLIAECVCLRRNFLDKATDAERGEPTRSVLCPQPLMISAIPIPNVTSALAFPAIMHRLESYLIVMEGCQLLGLEIDPIYALEAFTKDSDNTEDHRTLQLHVQRGMGKNYERLEFLGDSFLKMATSIALFCQNPDDDEYEYHVNRMVLICNRNLFNAATKIGLYKYIRSRGFSRHAWYPPGLQLLHGRNFVRHLESESNHSLGEKTIADVCEALIAASFLTEGKEHPFDTAVQAVTVFVDSENHKATCWKDYESSYTKPKYQLKAADANEKDLANKIFDLIGYRFSYPPILRSAFTHPSYPSAWAKVPCYQRLEFLGDALLDMVCVDSLFKRFPDKDPQWLTEHKMAMVSNKFLGALAVKLGFHRHLQHFSNPIQSSVPQYAEELQLAEEESKGAMDYWLGTKESPKCLPDMVEAFVAAIFVDSGFNYKVVQDFFDTHFKPFFVDMTLYDSFASRHPTTYLHMQLTNIYGCTNYCLKSGEIPSSDGDPPLILAAVMIHGIPVGEDTGTSSRYAKVRASHKALDEISGMLQQDFRRKFGCNCREVNAKEENAGDLGTAI
ncbi:hypothetical protein N7478_004775 [Penicillium angulare]|uniref:uncharacterized protein n=1 Tax=Penicillium angulare TaxID=116970 RepID=UPI002540D534|nr:uncharacterized protein N7478_004775 [Penicillium angulare]KAJ5279403.1 hypothetical protein N7478_004775 [Penicillium angulare]